ncbi:MAG TPA: hypothetical protein PLQ67_07530 [Burkholderiaceae bacterium]|nr:hypothetical protein [Burkholderiaceae bacterium]
MAKPWDVAIRLIQPSTAPTPARLNVPLGLKNTAAPPRLNVNDTFRHSSAIPAASTRARQQPPLVKNEPPPATPTHAKLGAAAIDPLKPNLPPAKPGSPEYLLTQVKVLPDDIPVILYALEAEAQIGKSLPPAEALNVIGSHYLNHNTWQAFDRPSPHYHVAPLAYQHQRADTFKHTATPRRLTPQDVIGKNFVIADDMPAADRGRMIKAIENVLNTETGQALFERAMASGLTTHLVADSEHKPKPNSAGHFGVIHRETGLAEIHLPDTSQMQAVDASTADRLGGITALSDEITLGHELGHKALLGEQRFGQTGIEHDYLNGKLNRLEAHNAQRAQIYREENHVVILENLIRRELGVAERYPEYYGVLAKIKARANTATLDESALGRAFQEEMDKLTQEADTYGIDRTNVYVFDPKSQRIRPLADHEHIALRDNMFQTGKLGRALTEQDIRSELLKVSDWSLIEPRNLTVHIRGEPTEAALQALADGQIDLGTALTPKATYRLWEDGHEQFDIALPGQHHARIVMAPEYFELLLKDRPNITFDFEYPGPDGAREKLAMPITQHEYRSIVGEFFMNQ